MPENNNRIKEIEDRLNSLIHKQAGLIDEANRLRQSLYTLKAEDGTMPAEPAAIVEPVSKPIEKPIPPIVEQKPIQQPIAAPTTEAVPQAEETEGVFTKSNIEKFIGENLINKIGIVILVIGVAIGAKYSIEKGLISPTARIIIGYIMGIGLLGFGMKLKEKYENYSAVLVSGAMSILYFITYLGYEMYELFPQLFAFGLMLVFTAFTVYAAINYNRQIIAHMGLVGAYSVPFLLSTGSGRVDILFSYMALINIGILVISLYKNWKSLFYVAFGMTWLIFMSWYGINFNQDEHFGLAFTFLSIFFVIFYLTFIGYKLKFKQKFEVGDIIIILLNSFIFYAVGYTILNSYYHLQDYLGLFTLLNAAIHFAVTAAIYRLKLADRNLFFLISGLVLVFITIAIPVQLDGNWVTLLWIAEAALLFWIGRTKDVPIYEKLSYPLIALASFSLLQDWLNYYLRNSNRFGISESMDWLGESISFTPIFNVQFLNSILFIIGLGLIIYINRKKEYVTEKLAKSSLRANLNILLPIALIAITYLAFLLELTSYWTQRYNASYIAEAPVDLYNTSLWNKDMRDFRTLWVVNYTMIFAGILSLINIKWIKSKSLGRANLIMNIVALFGFLTLGLWAISELRENYISNVLGDFYNHGWFNIGVRYVSIAIAAGLLYLSYRYSKLDIIGLKLRKMFDVILHITIVWVLSSELLSIMNFSGSAHNYKLGLSILWGVYSLIVVAYGIWKDNAFLRIGAIILFGITLVKLFFYDISHLDTIAKTIVFVSLGILLLIISFLYNKYTNNITYDQKN
jgi:uncharacterized membrane protein